MKQIIKNSKGFTLIELLVVIAIIAILAVAVILTLNPAELLKQARDSTRVSDMSTLKSAISLYLADVSSPVITSNVPSTRCGASVGSSSNACVARYASAWIATSSQNGVFAIDGTGWVPVNFTSISSGAPIGNLPRDPSNVAGGATSTNLFYSYAASSTSLVFEMDAKMESSKYSNGGSSDVEGTDGGSQTSYFEVGTNLSL